MHDRHWHGETSPGRGQLSHAAGVMGLGRKPDAVAALSERQSRVARA